MTQIFIGNIDASAEELLRRYLNKFYPDAEIQRLQANVIKGKIRNQGARATTALIVLDRNLYERCKGFADDVLSLPKTHLYESEPAFREFLKSRFGCDESNLDSVVSDRGYAYASVSGTEDLGFSSNTDMIEETVVNEPVTETIVSVPEDRGVNTDYEDLRNKLAESEERAAHLESELMTARTKLNNIDTLERGIKDYQRDLNLAKEEASSLQEQLTDKDDEIQRLQTDLATAKDDVSDANKRLDEQKSYISGLEIVSKRYNSILPDLDSYKSRCAELEGRLAALDNSDLPEDAESYDSVKAERDGLKAEVTFLHEQINLKTKEVEDIKKSAKQSVVDEITKLKADLEEATSRVDGLQTTVDSKDIRIRELVRELTQTKVDMDGLRDDIEASDTLLSNKTNDLEEANNTIAELRTSIEGLNEELTAFDKAKQDLADAEASIEKLNAQLVEYNDLQENLNTALASIADLTANVEKLTSALEESERKADSYLAKKNELSEKVKNLEIQLGTAQSDKAELESTKALLEDSRNTVTSLTTDMGILKDKLEESEDSVKSLQSELDKQSQSSADVIRELESANSNLQAQVDSLHVKLAESSEEVASSKQSFEDLQAEIQRAQSEATGYEDQLSLERNVTSSLREQLGEAQVKLQAYEQASETVEGLQTKVSELEGVVHSKDDEISALNVEKKNIESERDSKQEKIKELEDTIESLNGDKATYDGALRSKDAEITKLKAQLQTLTDSTVSTDSADTLRMQLDSALELNTKLKDALEESSANLTALKEASESRLKSALDTNKSLRQKINSVNKAKDNVIQQLNSIKKSPFYLLGTSADSLSMLPKPITLGSAFYDNIFVFASGSGESIDELFSLFQRQVALTSKKSFLIIDLSVESAILKYFNIPTVPSPEKWLLDEAPINTCAAGCSAYRNVRVVSTGFNYFNALCLLKINWKKKLEELKGLADYVFINVGCMIDNIGAILFDTFLSVMNGHIIIRGTPRSIRSLTLRVVAMQNRANALVSSIRIETKEGVSYEKELAKLQQFYDTLGSYCDVSIITSKDILDI